jgi:hypothetical protein
MFYEKVGTVKIAVDQQMLFPATDYRIDSLVSMLQSFGVKYDGFVSILQQVGHYCA